MLPCCTRHEVFANRTSESSVEIYEQFVLWIKSIVYTGASNKILLIELFFALPHHKMHVMYENCTVSADHHFDYQKQFLCNQLIQGKSYRSIYPHESYTAVKAKSSRLGLFFRKSAIRKAIKSPSISLNRPSPAPGLFSLQLSIDVCFLQVFYQIGIESLPIWHSSSILHSIPHVQEKRSPVTFFKLIFPFQHHETLLPLDDFGAGTRVLWRQSCRDRRTYRYSWTTPGANQILCLLVYIYYQ